MKIITTLFASIALLPFFLSAADGGFCRKCEVMREYHKKHPAQHKYYEDYLEEGQKKKSQGKNDEQQTLPDEVSRIKNQQSVGAKNSDNNK